MNTRTREIAKFACGFETFHALCDAYIGLSGTPFKMLGIELTPALSFGGAIGNGAIAIWLGVYAWRRGREVSANSPERSP